MPPRSHSTTWPDQEPEAVHVPPLTSAPETPFECAAFSIQVPAYVTPPTATVFVSRKGTVDKTATPGAARSTSLFFCEKLATFLAESTAATDTTELYDAG